MVLIMVVEAVIVMQTLATSRSTTTMIAATMTDMMTTMIMELRLEVVIATAGTTSTTTMATRKIVITKTETITTIKTSSSMIRVTILGERIVVTQEAHVELHGREDAAVPVVRVIKRRLPEEATIANKRLWNSSAVEVAEGNQPVTPATGSNNSMLRQETTVEEVAEEDTRLMSLSEAEVSGVAEALVAAVETVEDAALSLTTKNISRAMIKWWLRATTRASPSLVIDATMAVVLTMTTMRIVIIAEERIKETKVVTSIMTETRVAVATTTSGPT